MRAGTPKPPVWGMSVVTLTITGSTLYECNQEAEGKGSAELKAGNLTPTIEFQCSSVNQSNLLTSNPLVEGWGGSTAELATARRRVSGLDILDPPPSPHRRAHTHTHMPSGARAWDEAPQWKHVRPASLLFHCIFNNSSSVQRATSRQER